MSSISSGSEVTMSGVSCPRGVTFGDTITLSPSGEKVIHPHTAYFNNGDYVVIWTEVGSNGPRIEFQLFNSSNYRIGCTTDNCSGELVSDRKIKIGTTAVGVYEDYTFLVAWSLLERSQAPWKININAYRYNVSDSSYMILPSPISSSIEISANTKGKYGFSTLSIDNGFIIAYTSLADDQKFIISSYKKEEDADSYTSQTINEKVSNPLFGREGEVIVKTVPTQYFFSVILSSFASKNSITIKHYKIEDMSRIVTKTIESNPRSIYADLSYGGTLTVAWEEISMSCEAKYHPAYKAQMFSDASVLGNPFQISDKINNAENTNTYLQQVITQSKSRLIATFLRENGSQDDSQYIVKIFDNSGQLITSNFKALTDQSSDFRDARVFYEMSGSIPTLPCESYLLPTISMYYKKVEINKNFVLDKVCRTYGAIKQLCAYSTAGPIMLEKILQIFKNMFSATGIQKERNYILFNDIYKFFFDPRDVAEDFQVVITKDPYTWFNDKNEVIYNTPYLFQINMKEDIFYDKGQIFISEEGELFKQKKILPSTNNVYGTLFGELARYLFLISDKNFLNINLKILTRDQCINKININKEKLKSCYQYFAEHSYQLFPDSGFCNSESINNFITVCTKVDDYHKNFIQFINNIIECFNHYINTPYDNLPDIVKTLINDMLGSQDDSWSKVMTNVLGKLVDVLQYKEITYFANGGRLYLVEDQIIVADNAYAYVTGYQSREIMKIVFGRKYFSLPLNSYKTVGDQSQFKTFIHELMHVIGASDGIPQKIYGYKNCKIHLSINEFDYNTYPHNIDTPSNRPIADCLAFFVHNLYSVFKGYTPTFPEKHEFEIAAVPQLQKNYMSFDISVYITNNNQVKLKLEITNHSPDDYYVDKKVLLLGKITEMIFSINGPSQIICNFLQSYNDDKSELLLIKNYSKFDNIIIISNMCNFSGASPGVYNIKFNGVYYLYTEENKYLYDENELSGEYSYWNAQANFTIGSTSDILQNIDF